MYDDLASAPSDEHKDSSWIDWSTLFLGELIGQLLAAADLHAVSCAFGAPKHKTPWLS